jgi:hypothetical protein
LLLAGEGGTVAGGAVVQVGEALSFEHASACQMGQVRLSVVRITGRVSCRRSRSAQAGG